MPSAEAAAGQKVPLSRMRQQIARVTVRSKQDIPHFYVSAEIDMTEAMELRRQVNSDPAKDAARVSVNDLIIQACVGALKKYPKFNASFAGDGIQLSELINVGMAIAEEEGLIVPAIMDCANKSLAEVARASKDLIERSKSGTLHPQEYTGGTFSISNLGMFDFTSFAAIIHPRAVGRPGGGHRRPEACGPRRPGDGRPDDDRNAVGRPPGGGRRGGRPVPGGGKAPPGASLQPGDVTLGLPAAPGGDPRTPRRRSDRRTPRHRTAAS